MGNLAVDQQSDYTSNTKPPIREARRLLTTAGQASPPWVGEGVVQILKQHFGATPLSGRKLSLIDVGCGLGTQMKSIAKALPDFFSDIEGIDWSPATVRAHQLDPASIYKKVSLCDSAQLPFEDGAFDIALSTENLEHLYGQRAILAVKELARVAKFVLITTPLPQDCVNLNWLYPEMVEAALDPVPLDEHDYICLESAVHKSTLFPKAMVEAGFIFYGNKHGFYFAMSSTLNCAALRCAGIDEAFSREIADFRSDGSADLDYKWAYVTLLAKSVALRNEILAHPSFVAS